MNSFTLYPFAAFDNNKIKPKVSRVLFRRYYFDLEQLRSGQVKIKLLEFTRKFIVFFLIKVS